MSATPVRGADPVTDLTPGVPSRPDAGTAPTRAGGSGASRLYWVEAAKAFAILGILLNHFVESFAPGPWFTNPDNAFPALATRLHTFFPSGPNPIVAGIRFLGWLGDAGPGVFIFASGLGLTLSMLARTGTELGAAFDTPAFYRRRAARLYPLYIAMHFVILAIALGVPGDRLTFGSPLTLLSAAGLRFTPTLFFLISPSWWFVWLVLQLYVIYPLLWRAAGRLGLGPFFLATVVFTLLSRAVGIAWSEHRYFWLTGMFFGSRLAEFSAGMVAAAWIARHRGAEIPAARVAGIGALCYVTGLGASFFLWGALVSNLLVTVGLVGLAYGAWSVIKQTSPSLGRAVIWLGSASYAVFLLHQPLLRWTAGLLHAHVALHAVAAAGVLALSVPGAVAVERMVAWVEREVAPWTASRRPLFSWTVGIIVPVLLAGVEPHLADEGPAQRGLYVLLAAAVVLTVWLEWTAVRSARSEGFLAPFLRRTALVSAVTTLFVLPPGFGYLAVLGGVATAAAVTALAAWRRPPAHAWVSGIAIAGVTFAVVELALTRVAPTEAGGWGERAALMVHTTRGFALIPNRITHLRYNDYNYVVHTNSMGLPGPEITPTPPTPSTWRLLAVGDAFTMPEGLDYASSYPAVLNTALRRCTAGDSVQVIDGGVTGYGPNEEEPEMQELIPLLHPNVVVYQFFVNEWSDIRVDSATRRQGIGLESSRSGRTGLLLRSQLVTHLSEDYDALTSRMRGRLSQRQRWKLLLDYYHRGPNVLYAPDNIARMTAFLTSIRDAARAEHADLLIAFVPGAVQVSRPADLAYLPRSAVPLSDTVTYDLDRPLAELRPLAAQVGLPILDLTDSLRRHEPQPVYYRDAWHWNAEGHRAAAGAVLAALRERHELPPGC